MPDRDDEANWPQLRVRFTEVIGSRTLDDWIAVFADLDACVFPVRTYTASAADPHLSARGTWVDVDGIVQPAPAPRFDRTPTSIDRPPAPAGHHTDEVLRDAGFAPDEIAQLRSSGAVA